MGLPQWLSSKESACDAKDVGDTSSRVGKIPWRRAWQPTPGRIPWTEEPGRPCSPQGHKELDTTKAAEHTRTWVQSIGEYLEKCG